LPRLFLLLKKKVVCRNATRRRSPNCRNELNR
jgi:hypothetical protein